MLSTLLLYALVLVGATALCWWGSLRLERGAEVLSRAYGLPEVVQGTLVVAVASSLPELTTVVFSAALHGDFELGMSAIVGSAIFNILIIPGLSAWAGDGGLRADRALVYRDAQFYLTSVAVLLLTFSFAVIYAPVEGAELTGRLTRVPAMVPLLLYGLYLFLQHQETREHSVVRDEATEGGKDPREGVGRAWRDMGLGVVAVVVAVEGLLIVAIGLGDLMGTPSFLWGATVVAAATSLPDAIISLRSAGRGQGSLSLGNVLGSNIFDLLVAIPAGVLIAGATQVDYRVAAPLMAFLTLGTIVLFAATRTNLRLGRREATLLLLLYVAFVVWLGLETAGVTSFLAGAAAS